MEEQWDQVERSPLPPYPAERDC